MADENVPGFVRWLERGSVRIPQVGSVLRLGDHLGAWKARWGIGRMTYLVPPGLYAIGDPGADDEVVVTANYKMTYDLVRRALAGRNVWLLVLETHGINVWCAAGKGSFGTEELVRRIEVSGLGSVVSHRRLLLPILGASGVAAHEVKRRTGFGVRYAAIRAEQLPEYLDNGGRTTRAMRELTFTLRERLVLVPVELVQALLPTTILSLVAAVAAAGANGWSLAAGLWAALGFWGAMVTGTAVAPVLLPWLPGTSFAVKGAVAGLAWTVLWCLLAGVRGWSAAASLAALPAVSAFFTLNFTGCTPFTSRSGVKRELGLAMPAFGAALAGGVLLWLAGIFS